MRSASLAAMVFLAGCTFDGRSGQNNRADGGGDGDAGESDAALTVSEATLAFTNPTGAQLLVVPVLVRLEAPCIDYDLAGTDGSHLRFFDGATELAHEVEEWVPGGQSTVWVSHPQLEPNATEMLTLRFGPGVSAATRTSEEVWQRYEGVWHLGEVGDSLPNAASASFAGTSTNTTREGASIIGSGRSFSSGAPSMIEFTDSASLLSGWDLMTFELWLRPSYASDGAWPSDLASGDQYFAAAGLIPANTFVLYRSGSAANQGWAQSRLEFDTGGVSERVATNNNAWNHIAITVKGDNSGGSSDARYFINGVRELAPNLNNATLLTSLTNFLLGGPLGFEGSLDEVRIANERRSDSYIQFVHAAANDPSFVTCMPL